MQSPVGKDIVGHSISFEEARMGLGKYFRLEPNEQEEIDILHVIRLDAIIPDTITLLLQEAEDTDQILKTEKNKEEPH